MKTTIRIGILLISLLISKGVSAEDSSFLSVLEDVPLMVGLDEAVDESMYFDTPDGRIVNAYAVGAVTKTSIVTYYKESLPSLGWDVVSEMDFARDGEVLTLSVHTEGQTSTIRFALSPQKK